MNQGNDIVNPVADSNPADQAAHGLTRRGFLKGSAAVAASLMIGVHLPGRANAQTAAASDAALSPNAFVRINQDSTVTVIVKHIEFGQGPVTGLSTLVAEELDADWDQMRAELAPANTEKYANKLFGLQGTGGSTAMASSYEPMRQAGAAARAVLVQAAANRWGVDASEITVSKGTISHSTSNQSASFGELVADASQLEVPAEPTLKSPDQFKLIGTQVRKLDTRDKTNGKQNFTLDLYPDNMVVATILHPPQFGATMASLDDSKARQVKGVIDVKAVPAGVAVYAEDTYAALKGRKALEVKWDAGKAEKRSTTQMEQDYSRAAAKPGLDARKEGDVENALNSADRIIEAEYFLSLIHI